MRLHLQTRKTAKIKKVQEMKANQGRIYNGPTQACLLISIVERLHKPALEIFIFRIYLSHMSVIGHGTHTNQNIEPLNSKCPNSKLIWSNRMQSSTLPTIQPIAIGKSSFTNMSKLHKHHQQCPLKQYLSIYR